MYKGHLQSLWTQLITPSWNFVEVQWPSLFQVMHFLQHSIHSWKCAADHWSLWNFLPWSSLFMVREARNHMGQDWDCMANVLMGFHQSTFSKSNTELIQIWLYVISGLFQPWKGSSEARILRSGWSIVRTALFAKGGIWEKRPSLHLHKVPTQSNKVSPQTLQMTLILTLPA
jgi:hypothetical protein